MTPTRRYDEQEIGEILRIAAEVESDSGVIASGSAAGLTLPEIQDIGREVGIEPTSIERAARSMDAVGTSGPSPAARLLGAPRSVSRVAPLDRELTDTEWSRLVVVLRETFGARGETETLGPIRTWYNGNLQVHVEPWERGQRVRMETFKGNASELVTMGGMFLALALLMGLLIFLKKGVDPGLVLPAAFGLVGSGMIGGTWLMLPRWAGERAEQMEAIAARIPAIMEADAPRTDPTPGAAR